MKPMLLNHALAETVRRLRLRRGISQERLAEVAGIDRTNVSGIERCRRNVTLSTLERLIPALAEWPSEFFTEMMRTLNETQVSPEQ